MQEPGKEHAADRTARRRRIFVLYAGILSANVACWLWALAAFRDQPVLLGSALLAYVLGLRHAVDPDHIAAIDNVTRKLMQTGSRPISVGFWFALGHSSLIVVAAGAVALTAASLEDARFEAWRSFGGLVGTGASVIFLFLIAGFNIVVLAGVWRAYRQVKRLGTYAEENVERLLAGRGLISRVLRPLSAMISRSWHMFPLGFLFGLGFDTATEISLFGLSAAEAANGISFWSIMAFPALFTAAMTLVDTTDGVLMMEAYGWAYVTPERKLMYNLVITSLSVVVALVIGSIEALGLLVERLHLSGPVWDVVAEINRSFGLLGFGIIGLFVLAWFAALMLLRRGPRLSVE